MRAVLVALLAGGCSPDKTGDLSCGDGTHEVDGSCVPDSNADDTGAPG